jgi:Kef-type K+ transport system membrane component KefB
VDIIIAGGLEVIVVVSGLVNRLTDWLLRPLLQRLEDSNPSGALTTDLLKYAAIVIGLLVALPSGLNIFNPAIINPTVGAILTGIIAGGGANLLADVTHGARATILPVR